MTLKLYDTNSYLKEFSSVVLSCEEKGGNYATVLDKTAFYPEGGGQSCDTGTLGDANVLDVQIKDNIIIHTLDKMIKVGEPITGKINFSERFRKMQNHSGEHIVSGLIHSIFGYNNVGFHMGSEDITADYDGLLSAQDLIKIENLANEAIYKNCEISAEYPDPKLLPDIPYRSKLELTENVRIVTIPGYDICACCAPHVKATGEIGIIKLLDSEKHKGGTRLHMLCGYDALEDYQSKYYHIKAISAHLSTKQTEAYEAVLRMEKEISEYKNTTYFLKKALLEARLNELSETQGNLCIFENTLESESLRKIANEGAKLCKKICIVLSGDDKKGYSYIAKSETIPLKDEVKKISAALMGKGGGSNEMIQGRLSATKEEIKAYFA